MAQYQEVLRLKPDYAERTTIWALPSRPRSIGGSVVQYREAIRLKPDYAVAHNNLGIALKEQEVFS